MPQAIQIETQAEQQSLAPLDAQRAAGRTSREFALHRTEEALDQTSTPVEPPGKGPTHFGAHTVDTLDFLPAHGGDHTVRPELLADIGVIPLAIELGFGQHQAHTCLLASRPDNGWHIRAVVPEAASRHRRQHELLIQIDHDHPLQPLPPRQRFLPKTIQSVHEKRTDRSLCQTRGVDCHAGSSPPLLANAAQSAPRLADRPIDRLIIQALRKAMRSREIGHADQSQRLTQFAMLAEPYPRLRENSSFPSASDKESLPVGPV